MKKLLVVAALAAAVVYGGVRLLRGDGARGGVVLDRVWVDHLPKNDKDQVSFFAALTEQPLGIFQTSSQWKSQHELFMYEGTGEELRITYPQSGEREKVRAKGRACREADWDFCLEIAGASRGVKRYYSRQGWEIDGAASAAALHRRVGDIAAAAAAR